MSLEHLVQLEMQLERNKKAFPKNTKPATPPNANPSPSPPPKTEPSTARENKPSPIPKAKPSVVPKNKPLIPNISNVKDDVIQTPIIEVVKRNFAPTAANTLYKTNSNQATQNINLLNLLKAQDLNGDIVTIKSAKLLSDSMLASLWESFYGLKFDFKLHDDVLSFNPHKFKRLGEDKIVNLEITLSDGIVDIIRILTIDIASMPNNIPTAQDATINIDQNDDMVIKDLIKLLNIQDKDVDDQLVVKGINLNGKQFKFTLNDNQILQFDPGQFKYLKQGEQENLKLDVIISDGMADIIHSLNINVVGHNDAPLARNLTFKGGCDKQINIPLNALIADADLDRDNVVISSYDLPSNGNLTFEPESGFIYIPNNGFKGSDTFAYVLQDPYSNSNPGYVKINIVQNSADIFYEYATLMKSSTLGVWQPAIATIMDIPILGEWLREYVYDNEITYNDIISAIWQIGG